MPYNIAYSSLLEILAGDAKTAPTRFLLIRDGDVGWLGIDAKLTPASARLIITRFKFACNDIPIDYHHSSVQVEDTQQGKSPAAGWIKALEYIEGEGLYAAVIEWSETAKAEIKAKEFKYLSPVVRVNRDTGEVSFLHSVALTNRPRTKDQIELLAAAERLDEEYNVDPNSKKKTKSRTKLVKGDAHIEEGQLDEEATNLLAELMVALQDKGAELADDAPVADVLQAALDAIKGGGDDVEEDEATDKAAADDAAFVKAKKDAGDTTNTGNTTAAETTLKAAAFESLSSRLGKLETAHTATRIDALLEEQVLIGKLLPDDKTLMKAARSLAELDETKFATFFGAMPVICEPGQLVTAAGDNGKAGSPREKLIAGAARDWRDNPKARPDVECAAWVNGDLRTEGLELLTANETEQLKLGV